MRLKRVRMFRLWEKKYLPQLKSGGKKFEYNTRFLFKLFLAYDPFLLVALNIVVAVVLGKIFMLFLKYEKCDFNTYICISIAAGYLLFSAMEIFCKWYYENDFTYRPLR